MSTHINPPRPPKNHLKYKFGQYWCDEIWWKANLGFRPPHSVVDPIAFQITITDYGSRVQTYLLTNRRIVTLCYWSFPHPCLSISISPLTNAHTKSHFYHHWFIVKFFIQDIIFYDYYFKPWWKWTLMWFQPRKKWNNWHLTISPILLPVEMYCRQRLVITREQRILTERWDDNTDTPSIGKLTYKQAYYNARRDQHYWRWIAVSHQVSTPMSPSKDYGPYVKILKSNGNIRDMQTVLRDKTTTMGDFKFYADRLIRLVVEEGLNQLPYTACEVTTPTGMFEWNIHAEWLEFV